MPTTFYDLAVLAFNPVAHYTCDDSAGTTLTDSSGNGLNGVLSGSFTLNQPGLLFETSSSINFSGGLATISSGGNALWDFNTFTLLAWLNHDAHQDQQRILIRDFSGATRPWAMYLVWNGGPGTWTIQFQHQGTTTPGSPVILNGPALTPSTTYFIAEVYDGSFLRIYVNGVQVASVARTETTVLSNNNVGVAGATGNNQLRFFGDLSRLTVIGGALSPAEVADLWDLGSNGPPPPDPPTGLAITATTPNSLTAEWDASTGDPDGYRVRLDGGAATDVGNTLTNVFSGLTPGVLYLVEVQAYNENGDSAWVSVPGTTDELHPPTDLEADPSYDAILFTWTSNPSTDEDEVRINGGTVFSAGLLEQYLFTGLASNTVYLLEARTRINGFFSEWVSLESTTLDSSVFPPVAGNPPDELPPANRPVDFLCPVPGSSLGKGTNILVATTRTGERELGEIPTSLLTWGRTLDDISRLEATVPVASLNSQCCDLLSKLHTWGHGFAVYREGERVWEGPIFDIVEYRGGVKLIGLDPLGWLLRRVTRGRSNGGPVFVVDEAEDDVTTAFNLDDPNVLPHLMVLGAGTGPTTQREIAAASALYADTLDDLADVGVNYTTIGRRILLWPETMSIGRLPTLLPEQHLSSEAEVREAGSNLSVRAWVNSENGVVGDSGALVDPFYGLVESLNNVPGLANNTAADSAADAIQAQSFPAPLELRIPDGSTLTSDAPYAMSDLVPGVVIPASYRSVCRQVDGTFVLTSLRVTQESSSETVQITLAPISSILEGSD